MGQRRVLVTGANRGIGEAICTVLAREGWALITAARKKSEAVAAAERFSAVPLTVDLADAASVAKACEWLESERVDALVNNAGIYPQGGILQIEEQVLREAMEVHLYAPLALSRAVVPGMKQRGFGRIVNLSSGYGSFGAGLEGPAAYSISKAALNALTVKLAQELPPAIKVNAVSPGWVRTRMGGAGADISAEDAAETVAQWVLESDDGPTGGFFREGGRVPW